ncbi:MAG: carbon-nitrogen hydrolase family protein [Acidobacteriota bacterium]|nr:carbon-nitrogen hydrolase family protein [Acidobacteriota bacterium]
MHNVRIALAQLRYPESREESVKLVTEAVAQAAAAGAAIVCSPECYVPGYRGLGHAPAAPDAAFLEAAWSAVAEAAARAKVAVLLGTERIADAGLYACVLAIDSDGTRLGFQDKVQLDPSEDATYTPASGRRVFRVAGVNVGIVICHEGWRYPETVRWAARRGAQIVFHPHLDENEPGAYQATSFGDPKNTFHEKAALCRAAENTCYFATVNYAGAASATTSAVARPDGTLLAFQPYGQQGLLVADVDLDAATGYLAGRLRPQE